MTFWNRLRQLRQESKDQAFRKGSSWRFEPFPLGHRSHLLCIWIVGFSHQGNSQILGSGNIRKRKGKRIKSNWTGVVTSSLPNIGMRQNQNKSNHNIFWVRDIWREVSDQSESLGGWRGRERECIKVWAEQSGENRKQVQQGSYKGQRKPNLAPHAKPTIQMYKEYNLTTYLSMKRGAKQTSKQKGTLITIESREHSGYKAVVYWTR